jgi:hypothetical protein
VAVHGDRRSARDTLVSQMLVNAIVVVGMQVYIGNTGILSSATSGCGDRGVHGGDRGDRPAFKWASSRRRRSACGCTSTPHGDGRAVAIVAIIALVIGLGLIRSGRRPGRSRPR